MQGKMTSSSQSSKQMEVEEQTEFREIDFQDIHFYTKEVRDGPLMIWGGPRAENSH